ncbi:MAG: GTPase HflX [Candidatus Comchoanobacterales bacterium]
MKTTNPVIIVYLGLPRKLNPTSLQEFSALCNSADIPVVFCMKHKLKSIHPSTFCSPSFAQTIRQICEELPCVGEIVFSCPLPADKQRNLVRIINRPIVDIEDLILAIFAQRAQSKEGKLQVEYAQYQHLKSKLIRGWTHLERQKGGIGLRGPGETQLELDRRMIQERIDTIKSKLKRIERSRVENRKLSQKRNTPTIALVGYTNAGKSTLFQRLTQKDTLAEDKLFMTLDPLKAKISIDPFNEIIITDTVGFIHHLPEALVTAFKATLQEITHADLLIIVHNGLEDWQSQKQYIYKILEEINAHNVPAIQVLNKTDKVQNHANLLNISATTGHGIQQLVKKISSTLVTNNHIQRIIISYENHNLYLQINKQHTVINTRLTEKGWEVIYIKV